MAQLVAHLLCKQRVAGSSPASSTTTTMNGEETCFFISESEEVVRNPLGIASTMVSPGLVPGHQCFKLRDSNPRGLARGGSERGLSVRPRQWFSEAVLRKPLLVRSTAESR